MDSVPKDLQNMLITDKKGHIRCKFCQEIFVPHVLQRFKYHVAGIGYFPCKSIGDVMRNKAIDSIKRSYTPTISNRLLDWYKRDSEEGVNAKRSCTLIASTISVETGMEQGAMEYFVVLLWTLKGIVMKGSHLGDLSWDKEKLVGQCVVNDACFKKKLVAVREGLGKKTLLLSLVDSPAKIPFSVKVFRSDCGIANGCCAMGMILSVISPVFVKYHTLLRWGRVCYHFLKEYYNLGWVPSITVSTDIVWSSHYILSRGQFDKFLALFKFLEVLVINSDHLEDEKLLATVIDEFNLNGEDKKYSRLVKLVLSKKQFWQQAKLLVHVIGVMLDVFYQIIGKWSTIGYAFIMMSEATEKIKKYMDDWGGNGDEVYVKLKSDISQFCQSPFHVVAGVLHPKFIYEKRFEYKDVMNSVFRSFIRESVQDEDQELFRADLEKYLHKESSLFTNSSGKEIMDIYHPVKWWKYHGTYVPTLREYALHIVSTPCTTNFFTVEEWKSIIWDKTSGKQNSGKLIMDKFHWIQKCIGESKTGNICCEDDIAAEEMTYPGSFLIFRQVTAKLEEGDWELMADKNVDIVSFIPTAFLELVDFLVDLVDK